MNYTLVMIYVKLNEECKIDDQSKDFVKNLKKKFPKSDFTDIVCFANLNSSQRVGIEVAMLDIKLLLDLSFNPQVEPTPWNFNTMRDILHSKTIQIIHELGGVGQHNREDIITLAELERILDVPKKSNIVTSELKDVFSSLRDKGYAGHVYLDGQLTVYVRGETDIGTMKKLKSVSQEQFDNVDVCILNKGEGIKMCTSIAPGERAQNHLGERGTLGAIAKMSPINKTVAISVGHFSSKGQMVKIKGTDIGKCIWPTREDDSINLNDVSIIELLDSLQFNVLHQNIQLQYRNVSVSREVPILFQDVFKGRGDVGFTTGTITSLEACLPFKDGEVIAYLVEGDLGTMFAMDGDSGSVVKLIHEENGKLVGCALVFGLALNLPNIRRNTCITIPLRTAIERFESEMGCSLSFDV